MIGSIWAIARHTVAQCLRMKIAVAFVFLLAAMLGGLPLALQGDNTLAGQIRTFLSYSLSITEMLLSLVAVLLSISVVTSDVHAKQIFTVVTKPLARWQYLIGRWLGVVLTVALLLGVTSAVIYGLSQHLRGRQAISGNDRRVIETEVFTARRRLPPVPADIDAAVAERLEQLHKAGTYAQALEAYKIRTRGDEDAARRHLEDELRQQAIQARQSAGPGESLVWTFSGIDVRGREIRGAGRVRAVAPDQAALVIQADERFLGNLLADAPVRVEDVEGRVQRVADDHFVVVFPPEGMTRPAISRLSAGSAASVVVDPTFQIAYKLEASTRPVPDNKLDSYWIVRNKTSGFQAILARDNPVEIAATLTVPARAAQGDGEVEVTYINLGNLRRNFQTSVVITRGDIAVLYRAGGFAGNFLRGVLLILLQVAFLSAVGVFAGSFLSFPVACLMGFVVLTFAMGQGFLGEAMRLRGDPELDDVSTTVGHYALQGAKALLPSFDDTSPAGRLADGLLISWPFVAGTALPSIALRSLAVLGGACLIFHKRELARVQV